MSTVVVVGGVRDDVQALAGALDESCGLTWIDTGSESPSGAQRRWDGSAHAERMIVDIGSIPGQGAAIDLLRQRAPLKACHLYIGLDGMAGGQGREAEGVDSLLRGLAQGLTGPVVLLSALVSLMKRDGGGRIVVHLPEEQGTPPGQRSVVAAVSAFFVAWVDAGEREGLPRQGVIVECVRSTADAG